MEYKDIFIKLPLIYQIEGIIKGQRTKKIYNIFSEHEFKLRCINSDTRPNGILFKYNNNKEYKEKTIDDYMDNNDLVSCEDIILFKDNNNWLMSYNKTKDNLKKITREMLIDSWFKESHEIEEYYMNNPLYNMKPEDLGNSVVEQYKEYLLIRGNNVSNIKTMQTLANLNLGIDLETFNGTLLFEQPDFRQIISSNQEAMIENINKQIKNWIIYKDKIYMPTELLCSYRNKKLQLMTPEIKNNVLEYKKKEMEKISYHEQAFPLEILGSLNNEFQLKSFYDINIEDIELMEVSIVKSIIQCIKYLESRYHKLDLTGFNNDLKIVQQYYELCVHRKNLFENINDIDMLLLYLNVFNNYKNTNSSYSKETYIDEYIQIFSTLNKYKQYGKSMNLLCDSNNFIITNKHEEHINNNSLGGI